MTTESHRQVRMFGVPTARPSGCGGPVGFTCRVGYANKARGTLGREPSGGPWLGAVRSEDVALRPRGMLGAHQPGAQSVLLSSPLELGTRYACYVTRPWVWLSSHCHSGLLTAFRTIPPSDWTTRFWKARQDTLGCLALRTPARGSTRRVHSTSAGQAEGRNARGATTFLSLDPAGNLRPVCAGASGVAGGRAWGGPRPFPGAPRSPPPNARNAGGQAT
jgi:hypothetical protein